MLWFSHISNNTSFGGYQPPCMKCCCHWVPLAWLADWLAFYCFLSVQEQLALQFGFPQVILLQDGDALVCCWAHEGPGEGLSLVRSFRLGLSL